MHSLQFEAMRLREEEKEEEDDEEEDEEKRPSPGESKGRKKETRKVKGRACVERAGSREHQRRSVTHNTTAPTTRVVWYPFLVYVHSPFPDLGKAVARMRKARVE